MPEPIRVERETAVGLSPRVLEAWRVLSAEGMTRWVYSTPEWTMAWWEAFGGKQNARVLVAYRGGEIAGVLPLGKASGGWKFLFSPPLRAGRVESGGLFRPGRFRRRPRAGPQGAPRGRSRDGRAEHGSPDAEGSQGPSLLLRHL